MWPPASEWATPSGGKKTTRIFFSWIDDFAVCSMWDHWSIVSYAMA